jgi:DNA repair exonuclease SbcCD ATPase subunit
MFERLTYDVEFVSNKRHPNGLRLKRSHELQAGFGAIVGPNESGKSTILELLRFSLFGSRALRGVAADYVKLNVEAWLTLGGQEIVIIRSLTSATLAINGETVVKGTKPVNARIVEMLGFGLAVFDVANSINQGDVEALSNMKPTERARLTGSVVGLDKIDELMKYAGGVALGHDQAAKTVEAVLVPPYQPHTPEGYLNRDMFYGWLREAEAAHTERARLAGQLSATGPVEPTNPGPRPTELSVDELRQLTRNGNDHQMLTMELRRLPPPIDLDSTLVQIESFELYLEAQAWLRANPVPLLTLEQAHAELALWVMCDRHSERKALLEEEARLTTELENAETATCPECDHTFHLEDEVAHRVGSRLAEVRTGIRTYDDVPVAFEGPGVRRAECEARIAAEAQVQKLLVEHEYHEAVPFSDPPSIKRHELDSYRAAQNRRPEIEAELATLEVLPGSDTLLEQLQAWEVRMETYDERLVQYQTWVIDRAEIQTKYDALEYAPGRLEELRGIVAAFTPYDEAMLRFEKEQATYELRLAQVAEMRAQAEKWRAAKEALSVLRTKIKQHLYPSLAKAASALLAGMTNGARRVVEIDEDFDVLVDGQRIDTLSGSGKAVANLSIRLGLGQVLTHRVLPVIFADEIDASMDDDRATSTQEILYQCARRVSQFIMVSHKKPVADWYIDLE